MEKLNIPKFEWSRSDGKELGHSNDEFGIQSKLKKIRIIEAYTVKFQE